jgi:hypothetical protein
MNHKRMTKNANGTHLRWLKTIDSSGGHFYYTLFCLLPYQDLLDKSVEFIEIKVYNSRSEGNPSFPWGIWKTIKENLQLFTTIVQVSMKNAGGVNYVIQIRK